MLQPSGLILRRTYCRCTVIRCELSNSIRRAHAQQTFVSFAVPASTRKTYTLCEKIAAPPLGFHELAAALIHIRNPNSKLVAGFRSPNTPAASNAVIPCKNAHSATAASGAF